MSKDTGGPAFPVPAQDVNVIGGRRYDLREPGMTLRDYFAAKAMQGFAADPDMGRISATEIALLAYTWADAMIAERNKQ